MVDYLPQPRRTITIAKGRIRSYRTRPVGEGPTA